MAMITDEDSDSIFSITLYVSDSNAQDTVTHTVPYSRVQSLIAYSTSNSNPNINTNPIDDTIMLTYYISTIIHFSTISTNIIIIFFIKLSQKQYTNSIFFKMILVCSLTIAIRSLLLLSCKSIPSIVTTGDVVPEYLGVIAIISNHFLSNFLLFMILIISANRYTIITNSRLDDLLFSSNRYLIHVVIAFIISLGLSIFVWRYYEISRFYMKRFGYMDVVLQTSHYSLYQRFQILITLLSIIFYPPILCKIRKQRNLVTHLSKSPKMTNVKKGILLQAVVLTIVHLLLGISIEIIGVLNLKNVDLIIAISWWNVFCYLPDMIIPCFLLFSNRRFFCKRKSREKTGNITPQNNLMDRRQFSSEKTKDFLVKL